MKNLLNDMVLHRTNMNVLRPLVRLIYNVCMNELSANCSYTDHIEYIEYRINGGRKSEENWFAELAKPVNK